MEQVGKEEENGVIADFKLLISKMYDLVSVGRKFKELVAPLIQLALTGGSN